ncbi:MAG: YbaK/EbsC family protein [Bryobacteraceae bacterium]
MITPRLQTLLDDQKIIYTHRTHRRAYTARDLAEADHTPPWEVAKTVVFLGDGEYGIAVLAASTRVDLERLRHVLGIKSIRLATEEELLRLFPDCEVGAMPPFGNLYGDIPVYLDSVLADQEEIAFNAGTHRDDVHMKVRDFKHMVHPTILQFAFPSRKEVVVQPTAFLMMF